MGSESSIPCVQASETGKPDKLSKKQKKSIRKDKKQFPDVDFVIDDTLNDSIDTSVHRDSYLESTFREGSQLDEGDIDHICFDNT